MSYLVDTNVPSRDRQPHRSHRAPAPTYPCHPQHRRLSGGCPDLESVGSTMTCVNGSFRIGNSPPIPSPRACPPPGSSPSRSRLTNATRPANPSSREPRGSLPTTPDGFLIERTRSQPGNARGEKCENLDPDSRGLSDANACRSGNVSDHLQLWDCLRTHAGLPVPIS